MNEKKIFSESLDHPAPLRVEINEINQEEFRFVQGEFRSLQHWAREVEDAVKGKTPEQKMARYKHELDLMIHTLDPLGWAAKFSTSVRDDIRNLAEDENDSLYYMTSSGMTLRLKKAMLLSDGLEQVIRSPKEKCLFLAPRTRIFISQPTVGHYIEEFSSPEFKKAVEGNSDEVISSLQLFKNDNGDYVKVASAGVRHPGHAVNRIYFSDF